MNDHDLGVTRRPMIFQASRCPSLARYWLLLVLLVAVGKSMAITSSPTPMPLISRSQPAFSSSGPGTIYSGPAMANDSNYQSLWFSEPVPAWIAYDLSSVAVNQRQQVLVAWYAGRALGYINTLPNEFIQIPVDYTIEINSAAGGGSSAPTNGWQTVVTVTGNNRGSRQHLIDLAGANWIRLRATASSNPDGIAIDLDVHSAPAGASDSWLFMGDSITGFAAYLFSDLPSRVNGLAPDRWPVVVPAAIGGSNVWSAKDVIDDSLALYPGRYVTLNYGTNGGSDGFSDAMEILIQKVFAAGKIPVIPHMPWSDIPDQLAKAPLINTQIDALYLKYPTILRGPDLYTAFLNRPDWIPPGDVHPNDAGNKELRRQWALAMTATAPALVPPSDAIVSITVTDAGPATPVIDSFAASPASISVGSSTLLGWNVTGATSTSISPNVGAVFDSSVSVSPAATTTYTLTATNAKGSVTKATTVTVTPVSPPPAPVITSFTAAPSTITAGSSSTLSWTVTGATSLSITPGVGTVTGTSTTVSPTTTTSYTLTASNGTTNATQSATVTVAPFSATAPVINSFTIDSSSLATTGMCTLLWNVTGATGLSIAPNVGTVTGNVVAVSPLANTTYTLSATNADGTTTASAQVTLNTPTLTLEAAPVLKIKRDDHVATIEMDFDDTAWAQLWDVDTVGRNGCGYRVQWWADATAVSTILTTDGCSSENSGGSSLGIPNMTAPRQLVTPNRVVQIQPLANNALYHVRVERLNGLGQICSPATEQTFNGGDGTRVAALRSAMTFFDDFNLPMGAPDERKWNNAMTPQTDPRFNLFFINDQCHVHTLNGTLNEAAGDKSQVAQRVRKPIAIEDGVRRRVVFDMDGLFSPRSVWYLDFNPIKSDLTGHMSFFDMDGDKALPAGVLRLKANYNSFSVHLIDNSGASYQIAEITLYEKGRKMCSNVRRSFDVRVGTDGIQVFVDGTSVIDTPFAAGAFKAGTYDLLWSTIGYNSSKDNNPYFLSHWDNFGFDGPDLEPRAVHNYVTRIEGTDYQQVSRWNSNYPTFTVNIPDDIRPSVAGAASEAWLVFNYMVDEYSYTTINAGDHVYFNGVSYALPQPANNTSPLDPALSAAWNNPTTVRIKLGEVQAGGVSPIKIGNNAFQFFAENTGIVNLHVEVITPKNAEPAYTPPSALHRVPMHAELPKLGPPAEIVFIDGKEATQVSDTLVQGPTVAGKIAIETLVGNSNWANWDPQQLNMPANSTEIWGSGGTTGIKTVELFLRRKGVTTGYGDRIAVLTTSRDAPAPQIRYVFDVDTRRYANGDYELYVLGTTAAGVKSHPTFFGSAFRWDPTVWGGAYEPVTITIAN